MNFSSTSHVFNFILQKITKKSNYFISESFTNFGPSSLKYLKSEKSSGIVSKIISRILNQISRLNNVKKIKN